MDSRVVNEKLELSLKWNNFTENIVSCLESSYGEQDFVDVTLACEGGSIKAHRLILSASSLYLRKVLKENPCPHPVIILKGVTLTELEALLVYMYHGEVRISEQDIPRLLDVARFLEIRGLATPPDKKTFEKVQITSNEPPENINNNSNFVSSELRSILLDSQNTDSLKKQCRQMPRLQPTTNLKTHPENVCTTFLSNHEKNLQTEQIMLENNVKEEVDDFSNDSMMFEIDNSDNAHYGDITCDQSISSVSSQHHTNNDEETNHINHEKNYKYQHHKLAFYEPRPCPKCNKMYRDAATLRTHTSIMHEVLPQKITCSCGAMFLTKYDMYTHRKRGHK